MPRVDKGVTHSLPETNQSRLNALEALLRRAKERPCPCIKRVPSSACNECSTILHNYSHGDWCEVCHGKGTITDPALQAAWELLVVPHPDCLVFKQPHCDMLLRRYWGDCHGTGYAVLPIEGWPWPNQVAKEAAVRGLLEQVVNTIWPPDIASGRADDGLPMVLHGWMSFLNNEWRWGHSVPSLFQALMEALNGRL